MSARDVTVVIPCMNEAGSLPGVLAAVPRDYRTVVVDNNSTDDTAAVAGAHGASVVREHVPGYGSAVHAGVLAAQTPVVCVLDGDGSMDAGELPRLVAALDSGADLAVGRRRADRRGTWPLHSRIGNAVLAARLRRRYGLPIHDLGAMRAVRRQDLLDLGVDDRRSGYPLQLLVLAGRAHWRVVEHDITYRPRTAGASKVSGSLKGTVVAVHDFWKVIG
ncbi:MULTISPECIES: glycosyltransferase family 2 protein [Rhodococcus]|uniref:Glycosyltransferase family 2 protein n=1 Tax=Rhodococcus jostii TaxID=132919 RepID=A0ABU4CP01_RHOJO|nr:MULTISPECIES: glycosyltransferase family 2 protein [Rhodococcus]MDI9975130.1 glycosyltransferase family 2 protein [Rhodococcus sp. IEGM 1307]MDV6285301.1 glycosyltransferase family 2 protein [Rhodococcus jostii]